MPHNAVIGSCLDELHRNARVDAGPTVDIGVLAGWGNLMNWATGSVRHGPLPREHTHLPGADAERAQVSEGGRTAVPLRHVREVDQQRRDPLAPLRGQLRRRRQGVQVPGELFPWSVPHLQICDVSVGLRGAPKYDIGGVPGRKTFGLPGGAGD